MPRRRQRRGSCLRSWLLATALALSSPRAAAGLLEGPLESTAPPALWPRALLSSAPPLAPELQPTQQPTAQASFLLRPNAIIPSDYDPQVAPPSARVFLDVQIKKLHAVHPTAGIVKLTAWIRRAWYDPRLSFPGEPAGSSLLNSFSVQPDSVWTPDVSLLEKVEQFQEECNLPKLTVLSNAFALSRPREYRYNVQYSQACVLEVNCKIRMTEYPFDVNYCNLTFSPWADNSYRLVPVLTPDSELQIRILKTEEFELYVEEPTASNSTWPHPGEALPLQATTDGPPNGINWSFTSVTCRFRISRYSRYYLINYVVPMILIVCLSWLTCFIPVGKTDRLAYCVTLLLTAMAVQFVTSDKRPAEEADGWMDSFQTATLLLITLPILETVALLRIERVSEQAAAVEASHQRILFVERWARFIFPFLVLIYLWISLGPTSPYAKHRHHHRNLSSTSLRLFMAFVVMFSASLALVGCWNLLRIGGLRTSLTDVVHMSVLEHHSPQAHCETELERKYQEMSDSSGGEQDSLTSRVC